ncbi:MAG TPA: GNAT family N-acetyltransferase [Opitutaceae bacterium]|nr:GNAT family N-acetyltransferase [Opitutaceae bacterium]
MFQSLRTVRLRTGEPVSAAVIRGPDDEWAERIERMLLHKGDPWNWQNSELLRRNCGVGANFFVLHREGVPFANIMIIETGGVALLGHVWTAPADRGAGGSSLLMELAMNEFRARGGRAVFLGTEFDSIAWRYYRRRGFELVEPGSGYMAFYYQARTRGRRMDRDDCRGGEGDDCGGGGNDCRGGSDDDCRGGGGSEFERDWFGASEGVIEPLDWPHWAAAAPLCLGDFGDVVRLAGVQLIGRRSSEEPLLRLLRDERGDGAARELPKTVVLRDANGPAVLGLASRQRHPLWPKTEILDVFCHPRWWHRAPAMIAALGSQTRGGLASPGRSETTAPIQIASDDSCRTIAYMDEGQREKRAILEQAGLRETAVLNKWVPRTAAAGERMNVSVFTSD